MVLSIFKNIINKYDYIDIEQNLFFNFIKENKLDYSNSKILCQYFKNIKVNNEISFQINQINSIKTLENMLELLIPFNDRKINGAFFTPDYIIDFILQDLDPKIDDFILDPSCGCGAFILRAIKYLYDKYKISIKDIVRNNIFGVDIIDYNIRRTKIIISIYTLLQGNEIIEEEDFNLTVNDSLTTNWKNLFKRNPSAKFDFIVGNPPYVKFQDLIDTSREYLLTNFTSIEKGTFNLYFAFFELGYNLLKENGKLGYITPNNYFTSLAGESLRFFFKKTKCISKIIDFKDKKIFNAQTYTAITFINKQNNSSINYDRITPELKPYDFLKNISYNKNDINELSYKKWRLLKSDEQENIKIIEKVGTPLNALFDIRVGVATLSDDLYFLDANNSDSNFYFKSINDKTFKIEKEITKSIYKISDFKNQADISNNKRKIIYPYKLIINKAVPIDDYELLNKYPNCYNYFINIKDLLLKRDKGKNVINPFYAYGRTQGLTKFGTKIITPTFSQTPRFMILKEEDSFFCNGYGIFLKKNDIGLFDDNTNAFSDESNIEVIQKILNSYIMEYYINLTSVSIEGGYPCYQKNFIEKFSIPYLSEKEIDMIMYLNKNEVDEFLINKYNLKFSTAKSFAISS